MGFRLGLAQWGYPADGDVCSQVEAFAAAAANAGVQLLVFPENLMSPKPLSARELRDISQPLDGSFAAAMLASARRHGLWIVFTMSELKAAGGPPFNTAVVADSTGAVRGTYRKCHLYDAHKVRESDRMSAGDALCSPIATPFCTLGVGICYDLRFPEVARALALEGCNLIVFPAAWHDGPHKQSHWETLLKARAIENECYVAGICHAADNLVHDSMVVDPLGQAVQDECQYVGEAPASMLVTARIDLSEVNDARSAMPILEHRRPQLYQQLVEQ